MVLTVYFSSLTAGLTEFSIIPETVRGSDYCINVGYFPTAITFRSILGTGTYRISRNSFFGTGFGMDTIADLGFSGHKPSRIVIKAIGFDTGAFYAIVTTDVGGIVFDTLELKKQTQSIEKKLNKPDYVDARITTNLVIAFRTFYFVSLAFYRALDGP